MPLIPLSKSLAEDIAARTCAVPGIFGMCTGDFGEIALLFPGGKVPGIRASDSRLEINVVVKRSSGELEQVAAQIRHEVGQLWPGPVDVVIADVVKEDQ